MLMINPKFIGWILWKMGYAIKILDRINPESALMDIEMNHMYVDFTIEEYHYELKSKTL